jgi:hypothetical protein
MRLILFILVIIGFSSQLLDQACCSGGSPISSNVSLSKRDSINFQARFSYEYKSSMF